tara:strand:- start:123 stop:365 length:243 start_codon:yes stop_codon:yes gene_type:complete
VKTNSTSFGERCVFEAGDLVSWTYKRKRLSGVVEKVYFSQMGGREVALASVFEFSESKKHDVITLNLKKLHKTVVNEVEN